MDGGGFKDVAAQEGPEAITTAGHSRGAKGILGAGRVKGLGSPSKTVSSIRRAQGRGRGAAGLGLEEHPGVSMR